MPSAWPVASTRSRSPCGRSVSARAIEVLTTPLTAFATTLAIMRAGATPVFADVDDTGALDLAAARRALEADASIRGLMPVHLYGHPMDGTALRALADEFGAKLIEDCAQSVGAERDGAPTGQAGVVAATSLYPTKNLGAMGDGGVLLTDDGEIAERARSLRNYGQSERYRHIEPGLNSRLDEVHAAILRSAILPRVDGWIRRRREVAERYIEGLRDSLVLRPIAAAAGCSAHHLFPVLVQSGDPTDHARRLQEAGVAVGRHYPVVCPDQPACEVDADVPVARRIAASELSLPLHPHLSDAHVDRVLKACLELPGE